MQSRSPWLTGPQCPAPTRFNHAARNANALSGPARGDTGGADVRGADDLDAAAESLTSDSDWVQPALAAETFSASS
jgi:hypothetical protein